MIEESDITLHNL